MSDLDKAREEYAKFTRYIAREPGYDPGMVADKADVLIAALEAENEALKCCGNCDWAYWRKQMCEVRGEDNAQLLLDDIHPDDPCHFTPSRWERRES